MIANVESEIRDNVVAQGLMAQIRVLGSSIDEILAVKKPLADAFGDTLVVCLIISGETLSPLPLGRIREKHRWKQAVTYTAWERKWPTPIFFLHAVLAERLGIGGREKFCQLQCLGYRIHAQSLCLPDAVLQFYVNHPHRVPATLQLIGIDELNLVLANSGLSPTNWDMSELDTDDIEGLKQFCKLFCHMRHPALKQSLALL
ncbi:hypothetical protein P171DRAFT_441618 [Karstenula rhodostoma CBS 690.94]|uniref:Uncharacterized protein n=1 Tax=Karstenula rhodostoma CBS 690.94 TaxID=1392251 RepID=A0A9P4UDC7_9PLEO|nr:hypothetical protein P171DRAFT_441618 [Karstenula rhodostoma CBS 690.94]